MTTTGAQLLRRLEPAVRPVPATAVRPAKAPVHEQSFAQMLSLVSSGDVRSERTISVSCGFDSEQPLSPAQLQRLGAAADLAEAHGARTALMLLDGRAMMMDVAARQVTGELADASNAIASVDAAVLVADESEHAGSALPWPSAALPRNVIEQLTAAHDQREAARGPRMSGDRSI